MRAVLALISLAPAWVLASSAAFATLTGRLMALGLSSLWCWPVFGWHGLVEGFWPGDPMALALSGGGTAAVAAAALAVPRLQGSRVKAVQRTHTDTHGHADWATPKQCKARFPGMDAVHGGLVVAELRRRDLEGLRGTMYDPDPETGRHTWGMGGRAKLLVDPARLRSTHSLWFAGSGAGKSQTILMTLAHPVYRWMTSVVVGDPKRELERASRKVRRGMGHRVLALRPGGPDAINIFAGLNPRSPSFEPDVQAVVGRLFSDEGTKRLANNDSEWVKWAKTIVFALTVHMLSDPDWPVEERTPKKLRETLAVDEATLKQTLVGVGEASHSSYARQQARSVLVEASETWGGIHANVQAATNWLSTAPYADLVSGPGVDPADICNGNITAFIQVPPKAARETPAILRCLYGTFADAIYEADGNVRGRVLFDIDEAYQVGRLGILEDIRDLGRDLKMTMRLWFQSTGQIEEVWGRAGMRSWYASAGFRVYASIADEETAREVEALCGYYTIRTESEGRSTNSSGGMMMPGNFSRGESKNLGEGRHPVASVDELLHDLGDDEAVVFSRGMPAMLVGLPMAYRRAEMADVIERQRKGRLAAREFIEPEIESDPEGDRKLPADSRWEVLRKRGQEIQQATQRAAQANAQATAQSTAPAAPQAQQGGGSMMLMLGVGATQTPKRS